MKKISGNILELVDAKKIFEMMDDGYNYMQREHEAGNLSSLELKTENYKNEEQNLLDSSAQMLSLVPKIPKALRRAVTSLRMIK